MGKLVMILAVLGVAYWYWSGPYKESAANSGSDELRENAAIMQRCIKQEERMQAAGGLAGVADVGSGGQDAQTLCAEKNNLVLQDGKWHRREN